MEFVVMQHQLRLQAVGRRSIVETLESSAIQPHRNSVGIGQPCRPYPDGRAPAMPAGGRRRTPCSRLIGPEQKQSAPAALREHPAWTTGGLVVTRRHQLADYAACAAIAWAAGIGDLLSPFQWIGLMTNPSTLRRVVRCACSKRHRQAHRLTHQRH